MTQRKNRSFRRKNMRGGPWVIGTGEYIPVKPKTRKDIQKEADIKNAIILEEWHKNQEQLKADEIKAQKVSDAYNAQAQIEEEKNKGGRSRRKSKKSRRRHKRKRIKRSYKK